MLRIVHRYARDARRDEPLLRTCWEFRRRFVDLQPHITAEVDWQMFRDYFQPDVRLETFHDRDGGALRAMYAWSLRRPRIDGRTRSVLHVDYGFVDPAMRSRLVAPFLPMFWLRVMWAGRSPGATLVGSGYPAGVLSFARLSQGIRSLGDPDLAPWERRILQDYVSTMDCIDPVRGVVRMRTRPREPRRVPNSARSRALLAWYEAQVPHWQDGQGLAYLVHLDPLHMLRRLLLRR